VRKLWIALAVGVGAVVLALGIVTAATAGDGRGHSHGRGHSDGRAHSHGGGHSLGAELKGFSEVPAVSTTARGRLKLQIDGNEIHYSLTYSGLEGPVLFAHIHFGQEDVEGGVAAFLCGGGSKPACPQSGEVTGTITSSDVVGPAAQGIAAGEIDELIAAIRAGKTYSNVHSDKFPMGEIRGQIGGHQDNDDD
jgi:hypothetical protein